MEVTVAIPVDPAAAQAQVVPAVLPSSGRLLGAPVVPAVPAILTDQLVQLEQSL
jgi:hypothetical protein